MVYTYATLDPRPQGGEVNDKVFEDSTVGVFGVEVTIPALADRCLLGNLDPQHSGGQADLAACVVALSCPLPPVGATLATVRADADSLLAMAVLTLRARGAEGWDMTKVLLVGQGDCAPDGPWVNYAPPAEFAAANAVAMSFRVPLAERVALLADWIRGTAELPEPAPVDHSEISVKLSECGRYAVVRADGPAGKEAVAAGYRQAPVVVALNEAFTLNPREVPAHRKYTVARWNSSVAMDWEGMLGEFRTLEPGWGGSGSSICGSTQNVGSPLELHQVLAVLERHLPA